MTRPRFTIRRAMVAIGVIAVILRLGTEAVRVFGQPNPQVMSHLRRYRDDDSPFVASHATSPSQYWSEYWRRTLGLGWPGGFVCSCKAEDESATGRSSIDIETSHDMDALHRRMGEIPWQPPRLH